MTQALALGLGSMFNHSTYKQNVGWSRDLETDTIVYIAQKDIKQHEELCISYGSRGLWFEDVEAEQDPLWNASDWIADKGETLGELELSGLSTIEV